MRILRTVFLWFFALLVISPAAVAGTRLNIAMTFNQPEVLLAVNKDMSLSARCTSAEDNRLTIYLTTTASVAARNQSSLFAGKVILTEFITPSGTPYYKTGNTTGDQFGMSLDTGNIIVVESASAVVAINPGGSLQGDCYLSMEIEKAGKFRLVK